MAFQTFAFAFLLVPTKTQEGYMEDQEKPETAAICLATPGVHEC